MEENLVVPVPVASEEIPAGFTTRHKLYGHNNIVYELAWSPNGRILASVSADRTVRLWNVQHGRLDIEPIGHRDYVFCTAWSPDSRYLATGSNDETIRIIDADLGKPIHELTGHQGPIYCLAWSPDGRYLASGSFDQTICIWDSLDNWNKRIMRGHSDWVMCLDWSPDGRTIASGARDENIMFWDVRSATSFRKLTGHDDIVNTVSWSPNGEYLVSASDDQTIRLWGSDSGRMLNVLEGHTDLVLCARFSHDGNLLASKSTDGTVRLWECETWETIAVLPEPMLSDFNRGLAFHPDLPMMASLGGGERSIRVWNLDESLLLGGENVTDTWHYRNAKVVLMGDSGVGKSGLGLALTKRPWVKTGSTHGCRIWTFESEDVTLPNGLQETRETMLWDLAGQPGYRQTNQLHLNEVSVALIVFDASNTERPLAGVQHWDRALRQALRRQGDSALPMKKFLVAARVDRGGMPMWDKRVRNILNAMNFDGYFETSSKEGWQIPELVEAIQDAIQWDSLPKVSSNELFQTIKRFVIDEKKSGHVLSLTDDLFRLFRQTYPDITEPSLRARFDSAIGRMENRALVRRLRFSDYVLLQPELLDAFASDLVDAAQMAQDGLGTISEASALDGRFLSNNYSNLATKEQERLVLIATVEELVRYEIVLKEPTDAGTDLIFPAQFTREWSDVTEIPGKTIKFTFDGSVQNIYAVLVIRLAHSQLFNKKEMLKNAAIFSATVGGSCGIYLRELDEGRGEITLFFDEQANEAIRFQFEDYVWVHLQRRALAHSVTRQRLYFCDNCGVEATDAQVKLRRQRGFMQMNCPVCDSPISLLDREERLTEPVKSAVEAIDRAANLRRDRASAELILQGKLRTDDFDLLLCFNEADKVAVENLTLELHKRGILPWVPNAKQTLTDHDVDRIKAVAICVGKGKVPWHSADTVKVLQTFVERGKGQFILVALPGCPDNVQFPDGLLSVDWRNQEDSGIEALASLIASQSKYDFSTRKEAIAH